MGSWRKQSCENRHQELKATRNPSLGNRHSDVPSWEKKFCSSVGLIPWRKLLDTKKCMFLYENVVKWNDTACEEAFHNAKSRFWAKINGLHCNISLPDPDIFIDEIDWNCDVDPDLMLDLENEQISPVVGEEGEVAGKVCHIFGLYQSYSTGWGDLDIQKPEAENGNCDQKVDDGQNSWEVNYASKNNGALRDEYLNNSVGWNDWGTNQNQNQNQNHNYNYKYNYSYNNDYNHNKSDNRFTSQIWRTRDANCKNTGGNWYHSSTFKGSRFHGDGYQKENGWRNRRGGGRKRVNFADEHNNNAPKSWNRLNSNPSGPVSQQWSGNGMHGVRRSQFCEY
ncbi:uncharacterized protein DDB_G0289917 [Cucurbita maxima]|uniref:Uncharacterized protein DDB_G0289917 n=1 Tax=Cucurbita maxima TaxID=3661 RepID=A0A6J1J8U4_CUCMA|nr:uncharacterized protein DDB_G0289917 [Cucurbita maxima]XP_022983828.1 uncharacterized protein DDB_G0289917 [Cucurbita maxima]